MSDVTLETTDAQISFANHAGDFAPNATNSLEQGTPTDIELVLLNLADDAAAASAIFDCGVNRPPRYACAACFEWQVAAPTTGERIDVFVGWTPDGTAANGNPGFLSGSAGSYTGTPATLDEALAQLDFIGSQICTADIEFQISLLGIVVPKERYGILVVVNRGGQVLCDTDDIDSHVVLTPITDDVA